MSEDQKFSENLDLLIKLLRKMKDKSELERIPGLTIINFDFFLENYERMKDQITRQLLQQFGEPIKQMVAEMVEQLKEELGEMGENVDDLLHEENTPSAPIITGHKRTVEEIDELLKSDELTDKEIDQLLDERSRLKEGD